MVGLQVWVDLLIRLYSVVDEALTFSPSPGLAGTQTKPKAGVFAAGDEPLRPFPVTLPMDTATGVDKPLNPKVGAVEQISDQRIRVVELGIRGDDDPRLLRCRRGGAAALERDFGTAAKHCHDKYQREVMKTGHQRTSPFLGSE